MATSGTCHRSSSKKGYAGVTSAKELAENKRAKSPTHPERSNAGDLGGFVQSIVTEEGIERISGQAWVADEAVLLDHSRIGGSFLASGQAIMAWNSEGFGQGKAIENALVDDDARITGHAVAAGHSRVLGGAFLEGYARILGAATLKDYAIVKDRAQLKDFVLVADEAIISGYTVLTGRQQVTGHQHIHTPLPTSLTGNTMEILPRAHDKWKL